MSPILSPARGPVERCSCRSTAAANGGRSLPLSSSPFSGASASILAHTTYARWPASTSSRTRSQVRSSQRGFSLAGTTEVEMGRRPPGSSWSSETSRSPNTVMAMVRGIGVAVITNRWGTSPSRPLARSRSRCRTPKRCCSSTTTSPRSKKSTESWINAWVPTMIPASPVTMSSRAARRWAVDIDPVSSTTRVACSAAPNLPRSPRSPSIAVSERWCWTARTSVGASITHCRPASTTWSIANNATTVLPEPTSPCRSRFMGSSRVRSAEISSSTDACPPVSSNGIRASMAARSPSPRTGLAGAGSRATNRRLAPSSNCSASASSKRSRYPARSLSREFSGRWALRSASSRSMRPATDRTVSSSGSTTGTNARRVVTTAPSRSQEVTPSLAAYTGNSGRSNRLGPPSASISAARRASAARSPDPLSWPPGPVTGRRTRNSGCLRSSDRRKRETVPSNIASVPTGSMNLILRPAKNTTRNVVSPSSTVSVSISRVCRCLVWYVRVCAVVTLPITVTRSPSTSSRLS